MSSPVLICTDGSELSIAALAAGVALLAPGTDFVVVTVIDRLDPLLMSGSGHAGPLMTEQEMDLLVNDIAAHGQREPALVFEGTILDGKIDHVFSLPIAGVLQSWRLARQRAIRPEGC